MTFLDRPVLRAATPRRAVVAALACVASACATAPAPNGAAPGNPRVTIDAGTLEGRVDSAGRVLLFAGIPYAAPPVGDRRWQPPAPAARWSGVREATAFGPACFQPGSKLDTIYSNKPWPMSEAC